MNATKRPTWRRATGLGALAVGALTLIALAPVRTSAHDHDAHAHHMAAGTPGYTRAEADYQVPDVQLLDANGAKVSLRSELDSGKPLILNFIFTSCTAICPVMSVTLSAVQSALGAEHRRLRIVSISIDPEYDTPARLKDYAARHRAGPDWHLLTGDKQVILEVARAFDAWRGDKMNHTPSTYLRAGANQPWVRVNGFTTPSELVREVHRVVGTAVVAKSD